MDDQNTMITISDDKELVALSFIEDHSYIIDPDTE